MADMKKDPFLNNEAADELSRQVTEVRLRSAGVDVVKLANDPDLQEFVKKYKASKKKASDKKKTLKLAISQAEVRKLAGVKK